MQHSARLGSDGADAGVEPSTSRRRWSVRIVLGLLLLLAAAATVAWLVAPTPLSHDERDLVGAWTYQWDGTAQVLGLEYEFRPDRTCLIRNYHPDTGRLVSESAATWRRSVDTLTVRHPEMKTKTLFRLLPSQRAMEEVSVLSPNGPDQFRYKGSVDGGTPVTGTMTRVRRPD